MGWCIATSQPNHFGWGTVKSASLREICILRHDAEVVELSKFPNFSVCFLGQVMELNVARIRIDISQSIDQLSAEILVEKQFQAALTDATKRWSRSAANSKQAVISALVSSGKSSIISAEDMPTASQPRTS